MRQVSTQGLVLSLSAFVLLPLALASAQPKVRVIRDLKHDISRPLAELGRMTPIRPNKFSPRVFKVLPVAPVEPVPAYAVADSALQEQTLPLVSASIGLNIDGLGLGEYGFVMEAVPPDTNGAVGDTQYVQWVNLQYGVFDKSTGALVAGPFEGNSVWTGFGGDCEENNDGDPIVQYDKLANRWILTQFSVSTTPFLQCVAISTTSDATGSYHRYSFSFGNDFPDYPKLGVWPDAYYISFNMFHVVNSIGGNACAMDRNRMLNGDPASIICFQQPSSIAGLLPSDLDGSILPDSGEPGFFVNLASNSLRLWKFHADFDTPANSTFTGPTTLTVANFSKLCGGGTCIQQPGTIQRLDSLADRLMYRLAYRRFPDGHEALVANHAITAGIRWYEIRDPNGSPAVFQQGTYAPDSSTRWMGSIAMDKSGEIALGYSVSSSSVYPSISFTGRIPSDTPGLMQTEQLIVGGTGSQTLLTRWGDYSAMSIDPVDDCTFWYTQEYLKGNGNSNWNTRIATLKFDTCGGGSGGPAATLSLSALKFAKTVIGQSSAPLYLTVFNSGGASLNISSISTTGDFQVTTNTCGSTLAAGASCTLGITFTPIAKATRKGVLSLVDDAENSPQKVTLQGVGQSIAVSPAALDFGSVSVGVTTSPQTVTVTNFGSTTVSLTSIALAGGAAADYAIAANSCGATIAPTASCTLDITFKPSKTGKRAAKLNVKNNGGGSPASATLTGKGI